MIYAALIVVSIVVGFIAGTRYGQHALTIAKQDLKDAHAYVAHLQSEIAAYEQKIRAKF